MNQTLAYKNEVFNKEQKGEGGKRERERERNEKKDKKENKISDTKNEIVS